MVMQQQQQQGMPEVKAPAGMRTDSANEENFRWCNGCACMFRGITGGVGECPASSDGHDGTKSASYLIHCFGPPQGTKTQEGWAVCTKCLVLSYTGANQGCQAGGQHDHSGGGIYRVAQESWNGGENQGDWRWCKKCDSLFFGGSIGVAKCSSGGPHTSEGSGTYFPGTRPSGAPWKVLIAKKKLDSAVESNFRWCYVCATMVRANAGAGICINGGKHDLTQSQNYAIHVFAGPTTHQTQGRFGTCSKCLAMVCIDTNGPCWAGGQHAFAGTAEYFVSRASWNGQLFQGDWRWCERCDCLFFGGSIGVAKCPSGQGHSKEHSHEYFPGKMAQ